MPRDYTKAEILDIVEKEAKERGIPPRDFLKFAYIETGGRFDEKASRGAQGAKGLFQFVPSTAKQYGIEGLEFDPVANTHAAASLYLDNQRAIVKSQEMTGRPYLSGSDKPDGMDMYLAHQQGAAGYRSIQAAIESGHFARRDTRAHLLNNIGAKDFETITGKSYENLIRMPDRDMALAFVDYWDAKFDRIRIPEKGIDPRDENERMRDTYVEHGDGGISLRAAYDMTLANDHVRYGFGNKNLANDRIDCSGWVVELINNTYKEIDRKAGRKVYDAADFYSLGNDAAASIVRKAVQHSGVLFEGREVNRQMLREGMIIGEDNGEKGWDVGRYKGIDHIVMVVRDPSNGELMVSQSRSREGVELLSLDDYLIQKQRRGTRLYASDPLSEARALLQSEKEVYALSGEDKLVRRSSHVLDAIAHELDGMHEAPRKEVLWETAGYDAARSSKSQEAQVSASRPALCDPNHPEYSLYVQSYDRLKQLGRILGFASEANYVNAAACLAVQAKAGGLMQVDHVMQGEDGRNLIVVQGKVDDPANRWTFIDKGLAAEQSMHLSTLQIDNMRQKQQAGPSLPEKEGLAISR